MKKMMTTVLGAVAAMMVFSLAACTPTADKNKTEAATEAVVKEAQTEAVKKEETKAEEKKAEETKPGETKAKAKASIATEKMPAFDAPALEVVSVYTISEDGSKLEATMDAVEELNAQTLVDVLVQYGVLEEGTTVNNFTVDTEASSQEVGPGAAGPGSAQSSAGGQAVLDLNQFPSEHADLCMQAVVNTFVENLDVTYMTIAVDGTIIYENMAIAE